MLANEKKPLIGFKQIAPSTSDSVIVPEGYEAKKLISWGDALFSKATPFDESKTINKAAIANANLVFGDNTDGMAWFGLDENRAILAVNNEYMNPEIMFNAVSLISCIFSVAASIASISSSLASFCLS